MDWSMDPPQAPASPSLHVAPASEHVPSPHVPSHNKDSNSKNRAEQNRAEPTMPLVLNYGEGQLATSCNWDGAHHALSIFGIENTLAKDSKIMYDSIMRLRSFIKCYPMERELSPIVEILWKLFNTIYSAKWNTLIFNKEKNLTIRKCIGECIMSYYMQN